MARYRSPNCCRMAMHNHDSWDTVANDHMMAEVLRDPKRWHPDSSYRNGAVPGPEGTRRTRLLVAAKNSWATCMRETADSNGAVEVEAQKAMWSYYVGKIEL